MKVIAVKASIGGNRGDFASLTYSPSERYGDSDSVRKDCWERYLRHRRHATIGLPIFSPGMRTTMMARNLKMAASWLPPTAGAHTLLM